MIGKIESKTNDSKLLWAINSILSFIPLFAGTAAWFFLPDRVPVHFNLQGDVDRWGGKWEWLLTTCLITGLCLFISFLLHAGFFTSGDEEDVESETPDIQYKNGMKKSILVLICIQVLLDILIVWQIFRLILKEQTVFSSEDVSGISVTCAAIGAAMILAGNIMPLTTEMQFMNINIPWFKLSFERRLYLRKFAGRMTVICGLIILTSSLLISSSVTISLSTFSLLIIPGVASCLYGLRLARSSK